MAKRKTRRSNGAWKKDTAWSVYKDVRLSAALYLSFSSPGIVASGWRVMYDRDKMAYAPMIEFGSRQQLDLDAAKRHVERNYDKLIEQLEAKIASHEEWKARKALAKSEKKAETDTAPN